MKYRTIKLLLLTVSIRVTQAFVRAPKSPARANVVKPLFLTADELTPVIEGYRNEAFFWFFGASGGAGIARSQFPKMYENTRAIQNLAGVGPTEGGETIGISPLCGYPQDLCKADVLKVVNNPKTVTEMVEENPIPESFLATKGYLVYEAFVASNPHCNPLAVRAVFDTFAQSTNVVEPDVAQQKINTYKADPSCEAFKSALLVSKLSGFAAIATLLFLLGIADVFAFQDVAKGKLRTK